MKRYEGSEIIGYRAPKFDEYGLALSAPTEISPPKYGKSFAVDGQLSRYTYVAGESLTSTELLRNSSWNSNVWDSKFCMRRKWASAAGSGRPFPATPMKTG